MNTHNTHQTDTWGSAAEIRLKPESDLKSLDLSSQCGYYDAENLHRCISVLAIQRESSSTHNTSSLSLKRRHKKTTGRQTGQYESIMFREKNSKRQSVNQTVQQSVNRKKIGWSVVGCCLPNSCTASGFWWCNVIYWLVKSKHPHGWQFNRWSREQKSLSRFVSAV